MAAALQHLQLYTYDALIESIHRTVNIPVQQRELAQPTSNLVELLYTKFIQLIFGFEFDEYLADIHQQPDSVGHNLRRCRKRLTGATSNSLMPSC